MSERARSLQDRDLIRLYRDEGLTLQQVADRCTRSHAWVRQRLVELGVTIRRRGASRETAGRMAKAVSMYTNDELSTAEIATELNMSLSWVSLTLRQAEVELRPKGTAVDVKQIVNMYDQDRMSLEEIAAEWGIAAGRVSQILVKNGVRVRTAGQALIRIDGDELRRLYVDERMSTAEVAAQLGVSTSGVNSALQRCGITARRAMRFDVTAEQMQAMLDEGLSNDDIAVRHGVTVGAVTMKKRALKVRRPHAKPAHTRPSPPVDELGRLYIDQGSTLAAIASHYQVPHATVRRWLNDAGIERRPQKYTPNEGHQELTRELLKDLYTTQEWTAAEIGEQVGVSKKTVLTRLHEYGIAVRPSGAMRPGSGLSKLERLYQDLEVQHAMSKHAIVAGTPSEWNHEQRPALTREMLDDLYNGVGLALSHIALLTGHDEQYIRKTCQEAGIQMRSGWNRSPWSKANH